MSTVRGDDVALWLSWKRSGEVIRARILADVLEHTALSDAELTVLAHLDDEAGTLRQNALARMTGWDRSRLSHVLTRMEDRGFVGRRRLTNGVEVTLRADGETALAATRGPLATAVDRHFLSRLDDEQRRALRSLTEALEDPPGPRGR